MDELLVHDAAALEWIKGDKRDTREYRACMFVYVKRLPFFALALSSLLCSSWYQTLTSCHAIQHHATHVQGKRNYLFPECEFKQNVETCRNLCHRVDTSHVKLGDRSIGDPFRCETKKTNLSRRRNQTWNSQQGFQLAAFPFPRFRTQKKKLFSFANKSTLVSRGALQRVVSPFLGGHSNSVAPGPTPTEPSCGPRVEN